ncbi:hypothetical protein AW51_23615 (plasmid) [Salmonella enterica subsp. enterica serovar Anatum str. USDA-ARS-USMARC-1736]|nr:hypothetical protein AW51_23615 [Salmonella enterica subsp. enterica serovar Anatum str. USDA-ARS-USMARC-1736]QQI86500.1 hypothetical protein HFQ94_22745 [Salmonella enterica subsp. enterica serovar Anatum]
MPAFEWVHVQLHQQKGMISLSPPTICNSADEFDAAYWLLFNRVASRDPEMAKEVFGVSRELAELVAKATDSQLRHMSGTTVTHFTLRFAPSIIEEILDDSREELTHPVLKKLQQSLQGRGRWR